MKLIFSLCILSYVVVYDLLFKTGFADKVSPRYSGRILVLISDAWCGDLRRCLR